MSIEASGLSLSPNLARRSEAHRLLVLMRRAAMRAGQILREATPCEYGRLALDRKMEATMLATIASEAPAATFVSEESFPRCEPRSGELTFYIDPLDGSRALAEGCREASIAVAAARGGQWLAAVLFAPLVPRGEGARGDWIEWCYGAAPTWNRYGWAGRAPWRGFDRETTVLLTPRQQWAGAVHAALVRPARIETVASMAYRMALAALSHATVAVEWLPPGRAFEVWDIAVGLALAAATGAVVRDRDGRDVVLHGARVSPIDARALLVGPPALVETVRQRYVSVWQAGILENKLAAYLRSKVGGRRS